MRTDAFEQDGVLALVFHELEADTQIIARDVMECGGKAAAATPLSRARGFSFNRKSSVRAKAAWRCASRRSP